MPSDKGAVRKAPVEERKQKKDGKTSVVNKNAKESDEKVAKATKSVYGVASKLPSKARDPSVPKEKQDGVITRPSKQRAGKEQHAERPEKAVGIRRPEMSSVREPAKTRSSDVGRSQGVKVTSVPTRPVTKSKVTSGTLQQKPQLASQKSSLKDTSVKSKKLLMAHSDKKPTSLPSKAPSLPFTTPVATARTSGASKHSTGANKQCTTRKTSVTKLSNASTNKAEKDKLNLVHAPKNMDAREAIPVTEKSKNVDILPQDSETETSVSRLGRARTRTRTLSPEEVKVLRNIVAKKLEHSKKRDSSSTRTPKKPDSPSQAAEGEVCSAASVAITADNNEDGDEYSDDFEDYESDFEDATDSDLAVSISVGETGDSAGSLSEEDESSGGNSTDVEVVEMTSRRHPPVEEEKKLDSGNYDLAEKQRMGKELQKIRVAMEQENSAASDSRKTCDTCVVEPILADEGFVEEKLEDLNSSAAIVSNTNFVNFANARKRQLEKKATAKVKKRGEELLDMVTLDVVSFSLLDLAPIPYESYMKSYGRSNSMQVHVQTNEDSIAEEVQTDDVLVKNKWTQKPVSFCTKLQPEDGKTVELMTFSQDYLGVGSDEAGKDLHTWKNRITYNFIRLDQFLSSVGQVMLILLEESHAPDGSLRRPSPDSLKFSESYIPLCVESIPFLADRPVSRVCFPHTSANLILTVHDCVQQNRRKDTNLGRGIVCVWNSLEPSVPQKLLVASQQVCVACFDPTKASLVFGGLLDGSVCVWDLEEQSLHHKIVHIGTSDLIIRSPTYTTAEILKCEGHLGAVVSLQPVIEAENRDDNCVGDLSSMQVCSLDEGGLLITWTVIRSHKPGGKSGLYEHDLGLAPWGRVRLLRSTSLNISRYLNSEDTLQCCDLVLDQKHTDHVYVATISGQVIHCLRSGSKPRPAAYVSTWGGLSSARCIEPCPFGQPFFLVGCMEGIVRLHHQASEKPLLTLAATGDALGQGPPVKALQWSRSRPFVIFVLDSLSRLHVWDLSVSDMQPKYSIQLTDIPITTVQLSPHITGRKNLHQLVVASSHGKVEVHHLKEELICKSDDELAAELNKFLYYSSLL